MHVGCLNDNISPRASMMNPHHLRENQASFRRQVIQSNVKCTWEKRSRNYGLHPRYPRFKLAVSGLECGKNAMTKVKTCTTSAEVSVRQPVSGLTSYEKVSAAAARLNRHQVVTSRSRTNNWLEFRCRPGGTFVFMLNLMKVSQV
jgi:hypothetical protein